MEGAAVTNLMCLPERCGTFVERGQCSRTACDLKVSTISELVDELDVDEDGATTSTTSVVPRRFCTRTVEDNFFLFPDPAELRK